MDPVHAVDTIIAQGSIAPPLDAKDATSPRLPSLHLDTDSKFRWYEAGEATEANGATLRTAVESARLLWPRFEVVMLRGKPVTHLSEADIPEIYAADELDQTRKSRKEV